MVDETPVAKDSGPPKDADGITGFVTRVLEQLTVSAWLPAAMLIGVGTLLVQLHENKNLDIPQAVEDIANKPWGVIVILVFGLVLATMVTQAFSFGIIRTLEGYWRLGRLLDPFTKARVRRHVNRAARVTKRASILQQKLFESARARLLQEEDRDYVDVWEADVYEIPMENWRQRDDDVIAEAAEIDWREKADPALAALFYRALQRGSDYPSTPNRILPTTLGNVLRASEEGLKLRGASLERFVMDNYKFMPQRLMAQHDQFRDRLDMYALLVLVFFVLAAGSIPLLLESNADYPWAPPAGGFAVLSILAWFSYRAAIASARGYGSTLLAMNDEARRRQRVTPAPSTTDSTQTS